MTSVSEQTATWQLPDGELAAEIVASQARMCAEYARQLDLVAEADQRGLASVTGYRTTDQMLTGVLHISQREAKARVAQATLDIPRMRAALAAGEINPEHAFVIGKVLAETPDWVSTDQRAIDEQQLVTLAQQAIPSTVDKVADRLRAWWDADGKEPEDRDQDLARGLLGLPKDREALTLVAFGYPMDRPLLPIKIPKRRPFEDVVHRDRW